MDLGSTHVEVDVNGGRVSALSVGGAAVLASSAVTGTTVNWGSTFWPSPQSAWNWPPIAAIDSNPYSCTASDAASFTLTSAATTSVPKVQVSKKFYADPAKEAVLIDYTLKNTDTAPLNVAPWEISRILPGSLSFYPGSSPGTRTGSSFGVPTTTTSAGGIYWYQQDASATQYKLFDDGKNGWLATVTGTSLFVKQFSDVPAAQQFASEAEIEIFSSGMNAGLGYVELEQQGAMQTLAAGASLTWTVRWYVRKIPAGVTATAGSASLVSYVQSLL